MYNQNEQAIIWLSLFDKLTLVKAKHLLAEYKEPKYILERLLIDKPIIQKIVGEDMYYKMLSTDKNLLNNYIDNLEKAKVQCITCISSTYPEKLMQIKDSPIMLFAKGDISLLTRPAVAIVGTRNPTAYGREVASSFASSFAQNGLVVVSGLASGVDKLAHEAAIKCGGKTIAVLGGGFDNIYPAMNTNLAKQIADKGLLISEYRPNVFATKYTFPQRNRLISGICEAVFIAEAGEKSGALYTKDFALQQGKLVFAVPSNITNPRGIGTNKILKNHEAIMATSPKDIIERCGISAETEVFDKGPVQISVTEQLILKALEDKNQTFDELQFITKLESKNLNSCLTMLQIRGLIKKLPGNEFSL